MADSVELATGYVSLAVSTEGMGRQIAKGFKGAEVEADKAGKNSGKRFGGGFAAALKTGPLIAGAIGVAAAKGLGEAVGAAGDLEQSVGGVQAVFKGYAKQIESSSRRAATAVGLSRNEYNELATVVGAGLKNKGITDFAKQTEGLIVLGSDLAAQFGGSTKDAVDAIGAAMRGESDPIERYGVSLNETAVNAELAARGQDKLRGKALEQAKAQARLSILFKQTADAQGAFGRESDTLAGKQQRASAQWEDLKAKIGGAFLPVATQAMTLISTKMIPAISSLTDWLGPRLGPVVQQITGGFNGLAQSPAAGFLQGKLVPAFMGLVGAGQRLAAVVLPIIKQISDALIREWPKIEPIVVGVFQSIWSIVSDVMAMMKQRIEITTKVIQFIWSRWGKQITALVVSAFKLVVGVIGGAMKVVAGIVKVFTGLITGDWKKAGEGIKQIVDGLRDALIAIWRNIQVQVEVILGNLIRSLVRKWMGFTAWTRAVLRVALGLVKGYITAPIEGARVLLGTILGGIESRFRTAVSNIGRIWDGLKAKAKAPVKFIVDTVLNGGLIAAFNAISGVVNGPKIPRINIAGFDRGGWTGPGSRMQPAGIVHADEYVVNKPSRRKLEKRRPGLLDYLNQHGDLPGYWLGGGVLPLAGANSIKRHSGYGFARWAGDLNAPNDYGKPVRAYKAGVVAAVRHMTTSYGKHVRINHGGEQTLYAHLSKIAVRAGQRVSRGQKVGNVGNTGNSFGAHLHFELRGGSGKLNSAAVGKESRTGQGAAGAPSMVRVKNPQSLGDWIKQQVSGIVSQIGSSFSGPLNRAKEIANSPFGRIVSAVPGKLVGSMTDFLTGKAKAQAKKSYDPWLADAAYQGTPTGASGKAAGPGMRGIQAAGRRFGLGSGGTYAGHHPSASRARDFMIPNWQSAAGIRKGTSFANHLWANRKKYNLWYQVWRDRIRSQTRPGRGWIPYTAGGRSVSGRHLNHVHAAVYDQGGVLHPGLTLAYNGTGKPESIRTEKQEKALQGGGKLADTINVQGYTVEEIARAWAREQRRKEALNPV